MFAILRTEKLKTAGNLGGLNGHLTRTINVPNADPKLSHLNELMVGTKNLATDVNNRIEQAGITPRKNAVLAVEHLITTSPEYFEGKTASEKYSKVKVFKEEAVEWLNCRYQTENVVNVTLHMDEKTPHIHAVIVPIDDHGKLNARAYFGGRAKMKEMQDSFAKDMEPLGLKRGIKGSKAEHTTVSKYYQMLNTQVQFANDQTPNFILEKPPVLNREEWAEQQGQQINRAIQETALRSSLKDLDQLYKKRKEDYVLKQDEEKKALRKEVAAMEAKVKNSVSWVTRIGTEVKNHGLKIDFEKGKLVKMTDAEIELHQREQAQKKADLMAEQQRKQEQGKKGGMKF